MKKLYLLIISIIILCSCGETYYHSYNERINLMLLKSTEQPNNRKFNSSKEYHKKKRTHNNLYR